MDGKSYHELVNECSRDLCLDSDRCTADCHKVNCETSWHATKLLRIGWVKQNECTKGLNLGNMSYCSNCGQLTYMYNYCAYCGAKVITAKVKE
jgi:hypothetical protein